MLRYPQTILRRESPSQAILASRIQNLLSRPLSTTSALSAWTGQSRGSGGGYGSGPRSNAGFGSSERSRYDPSYGARPRKGNEPRKAAFVRPQRGTGERSFRTPGSDRPSYDGDRSFTSSGESSYTSGSSFESSDTPTQNRESSFRSSDRPSYASDRTPTSANRSFFKPGRTAPTTSRRLAEDIQASSPSTKPASTGMSFRQPTNAPAPTHTNVPISPFTDYSILPALKTSISNFFGPEVQVKPTPIQGLALQHFFGSASKPLNNRPSNDSQPQYQVLLGAETGSGKTLAYLLPLLNFLKKTDSGPSLPEAIVGPATETIPRALVLAPSHELTRQLTSTAKALSHDIKLKIKGLSATMHSSGPMGEVDVLLGTQRSLLKTVEKDYVKLAKVEWIVIDEADVLLGPGFVEETQKILDIVTEARKGKELAPPSLIFSTATIPPSLKNVLDTNYPDVKTITSPNLHRLPQKLASRFVAWSGSGNKYADVAHEIKKTLKTDHLNRVEHPEADKGKILIFCNTPNKVKGLERVLVEKGIPTLAWTGEAEERTRGSNGKLNEFLLRPGSTPQSSKTISSETAGKHPRVLVTTSLLSRGLDFTPSVQHVFLVEEPKDVLDFIHRAGRTGRAGRVGNVVVFGSGKRETLGKHAPAAGEALTKFTKQMTRPTSSSIHSRSTPMQRMRNFSHSSISAQQVAEEVKPIDEDLAEEGIPGSYEELGIQSTDLLDVYKSLVLRGILKFDGEQVRCIMELRKLLVELEDYEPPLELLRKLSPDAPVLAKAARTSDSGWWKSITGTGSSSATPEEKALVRVLSGEEELAELDTPKGILLTGPPGTGKSYLLSLFFSLLPTKHKARHHYHPFLLHLYQSVWRRTQARMAAATQEVKVDRMDKAGKEGWKAIFAGGAYQNDNEGDRVRARVANERVALSGGEEQESIAFGIAKDMILEYHILYFDELQLVDASSASLLRDILSWYWRLGGVIIATSNRLPDDLYHHGVQKERMASFLEALKARCTVYEVNGGTDWRLNEGELAEGEVRKQKWFGTGERIEFERSVEEMTGGQKGKPDWVHVYGRRVPVPWAVGKTARFTFAELCEEALATADYISIASKYETIIIDEMPTLLMKSKNQARRLINLVDALYESRCKIMVLAEAKPEELFFPDAIEGSTELEEAEVMAQEALGAAVAKPYRPNVSAYTPEAEGVASDLVGDARRMFTRREKTPHPSEETSAAFKALGIFTGEDEKFAYKRAVSRLIEMSRSPTYAQQEWLPVSETHRRWEKIALSARQVSPPLLGGKRFLHTSAHRSQRKATLPGSQTSDSLVESQELKGAAKLWAEAEEEEAQEAERPKTRYTSSPAADDSPVWTGEESTRDAVLRMLVDANKPLRGDFRTADARTKEIVKNIDTSPTIRVPGEVAPEPEVKVKELAEAIKAEQAIPAADFQPWMAKYVRNESTATPQIFYGKFINNVPGSSSMISLLDRKALPSDPKARQELREKNKSMRNQGRLEGAREGALDYRLGGGEGYQAKGTSAAGGGRRGAPSGMRAWGNLVEDRIERARSNGWFNNVPGRGKPIPTDPEQSNPYTDSTEYFMNRIIKRQGAKPAWIELLGELDTNHLALRASLLSSHVKNLVRNLVTSPFHDKDSLSRLRLTDVQNMRDRQWEQREFAYHTEAIKDLNNTLRRMNAIAPQSVRRGLVVLEDELNKMYTDAGPLVLAELERRRVAGVVEPKGTGGEDSDGGFSSGGKNVNAGAAITESISSRFKSYLPKLQALSTRSGIPIATLAVSFGILHELTALLPLVILFFLFQAGGVGISLVAFAANASESAEKGENDQNLSSWNWHVVVGNWLHEGQKRVDKVARRYGLFGYEKGATQGHLAEDTVEAIEHDDLGKVKRSTASTNIANAVAAYIAVKALLPFRIGASLALAPAFSRYAIEPFRKKVWYGLLRRQAK